MKKPLILIFAFVIFILGIGVYVLIPGSSSEIEKTADSFRTDGKWQLTARSVEPAYRLCLGGNRSPSVRKDWQTDQVVDLKKFQSMIDESGWKLLIEGTCEPQQNFLSEGPVCNAFGRVSDFDVQIYLKRDKDLPTSKLTLFVNPAS